jgi:hypothetical protein
MWRNLWEAPITMTRATWYKAIHDIVPTNQRLHTIGIAPTDNCGHCGERDTLTHQILESGCGLEQWEWMKFRIASILRIDQRWIPDTWILRPQFKLWHSQRHRATIWMIAQFVAFRTQHRNERTNSEYIDHLQALLTIYVHKHRLKLVGNYLTILSMGPTPGQNERQPAMQT